MKAFKVHPHANRVAVVTGAARGIGLAVAERLSADGARLVLADADEAGLAAAVSLIRASGSEAVGVAGDLSQESVAIETVRAAVDNFGRLDILVNNAGGGVILPFLEHTPETLRRTIDRNLWTVIWCCRAALPVMREQRYGRIVNMGADSVRSGLHAHAAYNAAKGGVHAIGSGLALEFVHEGITVNAIAPCAVNTPQLAELVKDNDALLKRFIDVIPMGRAGEMDEIASFVSYIASEEAAFITGQVLSVNGGTTLQ
ncbi:SDR family oxidoreductase [Ramlibacter sp. PS3R-8]|uniref:SDR family oxidoreductase n=1 Tax=Ramlibacter sp. PS3R-8 TaxID=3133437 RepID=UPI0030A1CD62